MPTAHTTAAARTALETLTALRAVTGKTAGVRALNESIDAAILQARKILDPSTQDRPNDRSGTAGDHPGS